jgi:hypothetical protein
MSARASTLAARRRALQAQAESQRQTFAQERDDILAAIAPLDRGARKLGALLSPVRAIGGAVLLSLILGRGRTRSLLRTGLLAGSAWLKVRRIFARR